MQWKQVGKKAQKDIYCREKKPLGAYTVPELLQAVQNFLKLLLPAPRMLHPPFLKMASLPCKRTNGLGGSALGWESDGVGSGAPGLGACEGL